MLLKDFLRGGVATLESLYPTAEARNIMLMLCESRIGTKSYTHIVEPDYVVKDKFLAPLQADLERLASGEPIQYIIGTAEFCGLRFNVSPAVLIPRPETELLCRQAIKAGSRMQRMREAYGKSAPPVRVLDLCTGSGCIAWIVALSVPGTEVVATDISEEAVRLAASQDFASRLRETGAVAPRFLVSDIFDHAQPFDHGRFDLILSNPPYIRESEKSRMRVNVLNFEPPQAVFVPDEDPLVFYKAIARWSWKYLAEEGLGICEINELLDRETQAVFRDCGFQKTETIRDFYEKNRFILYSK